MYLHDRNSIDTRWGGRDICDNPFKNSCKGWVIIIIIIRNDTEKALKIMRIGRRNLPGSNGKPLPKMRGILIKIKNGNNIATLVKMNLREKPIEMRTNSNREKDTRRKTGLFKLITKKEQPKQVTILLLASHLEPQDTIFPSKTLNLFSFKKVFVTYKTPC